MKTVDKRLNTIGVNGTGHRMYDTCGGFNNICFGTNWTDDLEYCKFYVK